MDWFAKHLLAWFEQHGRKDLPWQADINPYRVWVSEIMLQQTQVTTVTGYYQRFMLRFPDVASLATADIDEVLHLWTGLGYYARGRNLHKAAQILVAEHNGELPTDQQQLEMLPGIGRSTAGAIRAISMNQRGVILDGNVKRVLARYHAVEGHYSQASVGKHLWRLAEEHTPKQNIAAYTQGIMDLGATVCLRSRPNCGVCPLSESCQALATDRVAELPTKKKSAPKPVRQARFFIVSSPNQQILLEQRPQSGIWGGLWNPPERPSHTSTESFLHSQGIYPQDVLQKRDGEPFRHTFSHFHLDIEPVYVMLNRPPAMLQESAQRWVSVDRLRDKDEVIGLSAAALRLLKEH